MDRDKLQAERNALQARIDEIDRLAPAPPIPPGWTSCDEKPLHKRSPSARNVELIVNQYTVGWKRIAWWNTHTLRWCYPSSSGEYLPVDGTPICWRDIPPLDESKPTLWVPVTDFNPPLTDTFPVRFRKIDGSHYVVMAFRTSIDWWSDDHNMCPISNDHQAVEFLDVTKL